MKKQTLIFILLCFTQFSFAQNYLSIYGKVTDKQSGKPISYATISIKNRAIGTVTNTEGSFVFHIPEKYKNDSLAVSSIGYKTYTVKISDIANKKLDIQLEKKVYDLSEIKVKPKNALEIVKQAIAKIPENYPTKPINMDGFYREMTFENDTCVEMAEAACEFYYRPYDEEVDFLKAIELSFKKPENFKDYYNSFLDISFLLNPDDRVNIIEARASSLNHKQRFKIVPMGGPIGLITWDLSKLKLYMLTKKALKHNNRYKLESITTYNNRQVYVITYTKKKYRYSVKAYIDINSLTFVAFEINLPENDFRTADNWTSALYLKKKKKCKDIQRLHKKKIIVNYKEIKHKWYLSSIHYELIFDYIFSKYYRYKDVQNKISYQIQKELLINNIKTEHVHEITQDSSFVNSVYAVLCDYDLEYNPNFWKNYNIIKNTPLQDSLIKQLEIYEPIEKQFTQQLKVDTNFKAPIAKKINQLNPYTKLEDDYFWMQDIKNPDVLKYVDAENKYTENYLLPLKKMRRNLYYELLNREVKDTSSISTKIKNGDYEYYFKQEKGTDNENIYRKKTIANAKEELIVDTKEKTNANSNYYIENFAVNGNNTLIAYTENFGIGYENTVKIKDIIKKKDVDSLDNIMGIIWCKNQNAFYYITWNNTNRFNKLYKHIVGKNRKNDQLIYEEKNPLNNIGTFLSDNKYLVLQSSSDFYYNKVYFIDLDDKNENLQLMCEEKKGETHHINIVNDTLYSLSLEKTTNYILYYSPAGKFKKENWEKLIVNGQNTIFDGFLILKDYIVILTRQNMLYKINIYEKTGEFVKAISFKEETYTINLKNNIEIQKNNKFQFTYTSLKTPFILYEYDIKKGEQKQIKQDKINGYDEKQYKTELLWVGSKNGVKIPISLVYNKKKSKLNGKSPLFLTTYGSYGGSTNPEFSANNLSLIDRGFIYAIAHVRGGSELGESWHEQAMQLKKKNTFNDFIACAEYLIDNNYTSKGKIIAEGGSAGGLVMGAIANQRPDLFNTLILRSAYLDVLGSLTDSTAKFYNDDQGEFGNPEIPEVYNYIKSYSPYQNIKTQNYPNMLFYIGLNDNRVEYWQSLKSVAKLRALKTDNDSLFLKTELYAGHNGYYGSDAYFAEMAFIYAFILNNLGIKY